MAKALVRRYIDFPPMFLANFLDKRLSKKGRVCDKTEIEHPFRYMGHPYLLIVRDKKGKVILLVPADEPYRIILLDIFMEDEVVKLVDEFKSGADVLIDALR